MSRSPEGGGSNSQFGTLFCFHLSFAPPISAEHKQIPHTVVLLLLEETYLSCFEAEQAPKHQIGVSSTTLMRLGFGLFFLENFR